MSKFFLAPGTVEHYKTPYKLRNVKYLARWMCRAVLIILLLAFISGVVRGCMLSPQPAAKKTTQKVMT